MVAKSQQELPELVHFCDFAQTTLRVHLYYSMDTLTYEKKAKHQDVEEFIKNVMSAYCCSVRLEQNISNKYQECTLAPLEHIQHMLAQCWLALAHWLLNLAHI